MSDLVLFKIDGARKLLSEAKTIQEAKHISDIAEAARVYAKRVESSIETVNYAAEVKVRAERLLGEMLAQTPKNEGTRSQLVGPGKVGSSKSEPPTLEEIGIDKKTSMRSQQLASVPIAKFEQAIEEQKEAGKEISTSGTIARVLPKPTPIKVVINSADRIWLLAKAELDKIIPSDVSREKVLKEIIQYCQLRMETHK